MHRREGSAVQIKTRQFLEKFCLAHEDRTFEPGEQQWGPTNAEE